MPRYAAFLRGVMPTNAKMPDLKRAFERAGFSDVKTILGSGNVVFTAPKAKPTSLERKAEAAMHAELGRAFMTIVRPIDALRELLESDPYRAFKIAPEARRVVTFLRAGGVAKVKLPIEESGACVLALIGGEAFSAYTRTANGPVFMKLIEQSFGKDQTTRTWETVAKVAR
jgi:uncharacterized protein (DUF1697 family)